MAFNVPSLQSGVTYFDNWGRPTPSFQRYWQDVIKTLADTFAQIEQILIELAQAQADIIAAQEDIIETQEAQQETIDQIVDILNGTEVFTGLNVNTKRIDNFVDGLDADGAQIIDSAVVPLNFPSGAARSYDSFPMTSDDSSITISSVGFDQPGSAGTLTSGSVSGLSADTTYRVFFNPISAFYSAQIPPAGNFFSSPDGWLFIGDIKTSTGGVYTPPAAPPAGFDPFFFSGGMNFF